MQKFFIAPAMKTAIFSVRRGYQNVLAVSYSNMFSFLVPKKSVAKSKLPSQLRKFSFIKGCVTCFSSPPNKHEL